MKHWLFQANPKSYDFKADLENIEAGDIRSWNAAKYWNEMSPGDGVAIWVSGPNGGLMAIGELTSEAYDGPDYTNPEKPGHWVDWELLATIDPPVTRLHMQLDPVLSKMQPIAPVHVGTNFRVTEEQWQAMMNLIDFSTDSDGSEWDKSIDAIHTPPALAELANRTHMPVEDWIELDILVESKKQIIFEGPPGSGKTFVARLFARYLAGVGLDDAESDRVEIVQFHQSYGYEDFVAGIRPVTGDNGLLTYETRAGIFVDMCRKAKERPGETFVLIIDEINRGNLSRIFGELLYGLEYRDQRVRMQYPVETADGVDEYLEIPGNLYLIGTMNSTDRSLAMIDYALRRRFYFWRLMPVSQREAPVLAKWLERQESLGAVERASLLSAFIELNREIAGTLGEDFQIGHSYFMLSPNEIGDPLAWRRVWRHAIEPLLREYLHMRQDANATIARLEQWFFRDPEPESELPAGPGVEA